MIVAGAGMIVPVEISPEKFGEVMRSIVNSVRMSDGAMSKMSREMIENDYCAETNFHSFAKRLISLKSSKGLTR